MNELTKGTSVVIAARLRAGDESAYAELADQRLVEREGRLELDVGDLTPRAADRILELAGDRAADPVQLNLAEQGRAAFGGINLGAWLDWPGLKRFRRLNLTVGFRGKKALEALGKSPNLSPEITYLDLHSCDIGAAGCGLLAKTKAFASLEELGLDAGDQDRTRWTSACLDRLFPKKGGVLTRLARLSVRGWDLTPADVTPLVVAGRAPALRTVQLTRQSLSLT
jgi:hypothetical protein